jgi:hypothetical protein
MSDIRHVWFVLLSAFGVAWGAKMRPIEIERGGGALAFDGRRFKIGFLSGHFTRLSKKRQIW